MALRHALGSRSVCSKRSSRHDPLSLTQTLTMPPGLTRLDVRDFACGANAVALGAVLGLAVLRENGAVALLPTPTARVGPHAGLQELSCRCVCPCVQGLAVGCVVCLIVMRQDSAVALLPMPTARGGSHAGVQSCSAGVCLCACVRKLHVFGCGLHGAVARQAMLNGAVALLPMPMARGGPRAKLQKLLAPGPGPAVP